MRVLSRKRIDAVLWAIQRKYRLAWWLGDEGLLRRLERRAWAWGAVWGGVDRRGGCFAVIEAVSDGFLEDREPVVVEVGGDLGGLDVEGRVFAWVSVGVWREFSSVELAEEWIMRPGLGLRFTGRVSCGGRVRYYEVNGRVDPLSDLAFIPQIVDCRFTKEGIGALMGG